MPGPYNTPGVYVEEISTLPASVVRVETAVPAFIGYTEKHASHPDVETAGGSSTATRPKKINSLAEYVEFFGKGEAQDFTITVTDVVDGTDNDALISRDIEVTEGSMTSYLMYYQVAMYYENGGGPCYIVSAGVIPTSPPTYPTADTALTTALDELEKEDDPTLIIFPDAVSFTNKSTFGALMDKSLAHCAKMGDRFAIMDVPSATVGAVGTNFRDVTGSSNLKYGASYFPALKTRLAYYIDETALTITHSVTESPAGSPPAAPNYMNGRAIGKDDGNGNIVSNLSEWGSPPTYREDGVYNEIKRQIAEYSPTLYPCGAVAGVYCTVDKARGVWKAPANISLNSVIAPSIILTNAEQDGLNVDANSGKSINAIRAFTGRGILVWGARTLAGNDNEWRYVPVRRLFNMAEESIKKATEFVVFEPNDANTWQRVKAMVENFLISLWRDGALAGAKPEDAFFVNVGLGTSMTANDILDGKLIVEIGIAAVRPAEFIILKFSHKLQEA